MAACCLCVSMGQAKARAGAAGCDERVVVHTDRDIYIAGETLHYKVYLFHSEGRPVRSSGMAYMVMRNGSENVNNLVIPLQNQQGDGNFYLQDTLPTGYYELLAYTHRMRAWEEPCFFKKTLFIANRFDRDLNTLQGPVSQMHAPVSDEPSGLDMDAADASLPHNGSRQEGDPGGNCDTQPSLVLEHGEYFGPRQAVTLSISLMDFPDHFAQLSVSVSQAEAWMESDQSMRPSPPASSPSADRETNDYFITGQVTEPDSGSGLGGAVVVLNASGANITYQHAVTDDRGRFRFTVSPYYNDRMLFLSVDPSSVDRDYVLELEDKFKIETPFNPLLFSGMDGKKAFVRRSQDIVSARKAFQMDDLRRTGRSIFASSPPSFLFSQPRQTVFPGRFAPFDDLHEIAREIILPWRIRQSGGTYRSQMHCADTGAPLPGEPRYFLDGIVVYDLGRLIPLGSDRIDRIQVHNTNWEHDGLPFYGAVHLIGFDQEHLRILPAEEYKTTRFSFHRKESVFSAPAYQGQAAPDRENPDLRNTLYWNPDIRLGRGGMVSLTFYTSDLAGEYRIMVEGMTSEGQAISSGSKFAVGL